MNSRYAGQVGRNLFIIFVLILVVGFTVYSPETVTAIIDTAVDLATAF